jgi:predicted kinase
LKRRKHVQRLVCFSGLPGVGKSTLSKAISCKTGATIINIDEFKRMHVDSHLIRSQIDPPEQRWTYYRDSVEHAFKLFNQGVAIAILDEVFHLHSLRARIEDLCGVRGVCVLWVEIQCPHDLIRKRLVTTSREGHILSTDEALKMNLLFQEIFEAFPTDIENHVVIYNDGSSDIWSMRDKILRKMV